VSRRALVTLVLAGAALLAGCGGTTSGSGPATTQAPLPAGAVPSAIAKQPCEREARQQIASALGETADVSDPTWVDHLYRCTYQYPTGSMTLSIKELSSWPQTLGYFGSFGTEMGKTRNLDGLGQGAYQTTDGSVVVRKDWKVLLVDPTRLPSQFGVPPTSSVYVAVTVADIILGCWEGD
jgi:hypothetical protein